MNKSELVDVIANDSGLARTDATKALEGFTAAVLRELEKGGEVTVPGFGKFSVTRRGARTGRNPQTGEALKTKASKAPKFTAAKSLKDAVNGRKG